jgi:hypothetical protein
MTKLVWDQAGERRYETGIDRGVLFLSDGGVVPWNGLVSVAETRSREVKSHYIDGIKYLDRHVPGSYEAKLSAFTYPDELDALMGTTEFIPGVTLHDQRARYFHLSYRTLVGNDVDGTEHGYKVHLVYNVMASPGDVSFNSLSASPTPQLFEWNLTGTPNLMFGIRPTSHISLDSRHADPVTLTFIEETIYGTELLDPSLPPLVDLLGLLEALETL